MVSRWYKILMIGILMDVLQAVGMTENEFEWGRKPKMLAFVGN